MATAESVGGPATRLHSTFIGDMQMAQPRRSSAPDADVPPQPRKGAWYAVWLLFLLYVLSYVGRQIISVLVDPIERDLGLTEVQMGLIVGLAFTLVFALGGIALGWVVDIFPRRLVIFVGTVVWSLSCIACGYANSFEWLLLSRMGVGIGEATLMPAAYAFLSDVFPRRRLATALGIISFGSTFGVALALGLGGFSLAFFTHMGEVQSPFGPLKPWQAAFVTAGVPALVLSALALTLPEPNERTRAAAQRQVLKPLIALFRANPAVLAAQFSGFAMNALMGYTLMAWTPAYMGRSFGWQSFEIGKALALTLGCSGALATMGSGYLADRLWARGVQGSHYLIAATALFVSAPFGVVAFATTSVGIFLCCVAVVYFAAATALNMGATALQLLTPPQLRGRISGLYLFWTNVVGAGLGPLLVALITQHALHDKTKVGTAMAVVTPLAALIGAIILALARRRYSALIASGERASEAIAQPKGTSDSKAVLRERTN